MFNKKKKHFYIVYPHLVQFQYIKYFQYFNFNSLTRIIWIGLYKHARRKRTRSDIPIEFIPQCIKSSQLPTAGNRRVQRTMQRRLYGNRCEYIMITSGPCVILSTLCSLFCQLITSFIKPRRIFKTTCFMMVKQLAIYRQFSSHQCICYRYIWFLIGVISFDQFTPRVDKWLF